MLFYEEIFRSLSEKDVRYIVVGGIAFNLLGGSRNTADLDLLLAMDDNNLLKFITIMKSQGYMVKQPVDPFDFAREEIRKVWIEKKNMKAFNFYKGYQSFEEVDVIIDSPVLYEEAISRTSIIRIDDLSLPVISIRDLIKMKEVTGRERDMLDIKELKRIEKLLNEE